MRETISKAVEGVVTQIECPPEEPLLAELRAFVKSAQTREKPLADGWAGYEAVRVLDAAMQSARSGQTGEMKMNHKNLCKKSHCQNVL